MTFAVAHHRMTMQREQRQDAGVGLRVGDLVQADTGGEIRQVVAIAGAGDCLEAAANTRARDARTTDAAWGRDN